MPTRVLLEGPAIEPLLAQVRDEYGSGVRIISADKVRSGGFGGFFAKQHYELSVEVPDPSEDGRRTARTTPPARPDSGPQSLEQLLERAESRDRIAAGDAPDGYQRPAAPAPDRPLGGPDQQTGREAGRDDTDAAATRRELADTGTAFAELMAGLDGANHIATSGPLRPAPRPQAAPDAGDPPTVRPFRPARATGAPVNGASSTRPLPPVPSLAELMGGLGISESDVPPVEPQQPLRPAGRTAAAYGLHTPPPAPLATPAPTSPAAPAAVSAAPAGAFTSTAAAAGAFTSTAAPAGAFTSTAAADHPYPDRPAPGRPHSDLAVPEPPAHLPALRTVASEPVVANLMSVGMPERLAEQITGGDTYAGVLSVLANRPAAPGFPDAPGEILVLAGDLVHAVRIGRQLLEQAGIDQTHLLLAGPSAAGTGLHSSRIMHTPAAAAARAEKLHSADSAWVVLLDTPVGETDPLLVNDMCDAMGATALWAVVDATRKTADTARHLRMLGDVEALVVHGAALTADPATVLGLDLPIFSMDGKPATPHAWAAMLCARIAADIAPMSPAPRRQVRSAR